MKKILFTKMHALGNDFIVINSRKFRIKEPLAPFAKRLCHRRFGIGADQLLLLYPPSVPPLARGGLRGGRADFKMRIFNADGSEVEMCGNGIRCLAKYIWDRKLSRKKILNIETLAGIIRPERAGGMVRVDMGEPVLEGGKVPVKLNGLVMDYPLKVKDRRFLITCVSMGNPHAVIFVDRVKDFPVGLYGPEIENHALFPRRTNVEFVEAVSRKEVRMRVWERGTGETLACGTGASATAVAANLKGLTGRKVTVHLEGGDLLIEWAGNNHVFMTGPAVEVFDGKTKLLD